MLELKRSWVTLLACSLGTSIGASSYPLYLVPVIGLRLEESFGWSRFDTSSLTSVGFIGGALGAPVVGWLNDRWSIKIPVLISTAAIGVMLMLATLAPSEIWAWQVGTFLLMLLGAGTLTASFSKIICQHFHQMRGLALGVTIGAVSFISAIALPGFSRLIDSFGIDYFLLFAGLFYFVVIIPLLFWLLPESAAKQTVEASSEDIIDGADAAPWVLWLLGAAGFLIAAVAGAGAHLAAVAADGGRVSPALVGSVFAASVMLSRPITGFIIDHMNATHVAAVAFALAAVGLVIAALFGDRYVFLSAVLLATAVGADIDIVAFLASRYVRPSRFGRVFGWMFCGILVAAAAGPLLIAILLDVSGSYRTPFLYSAFLAAVAAVIMLLLPPYGRRMQA